MNYDPEIHHRKSIRLKRYDYSQAALYFITICCYERKCFFGTIQNNEMMLNEYGTIAFNEWIKLPERFNNFELDVFQIMPNHMHAIIALVGTTLAVAQNTVTDVQSGAEVTPPTNTVGDIVGAYKSMVANKCLEIFKSKNKTMGKLWQRNYYEHIIRNQQSYQTISNYITNNPAKWNEDKFFI